MFSGYLALGGTEVFNQDLTYMLVEGGDCPVGWIRCAPCPGLTDALGETPADLTVENAPWYDAEDPATHRFYGFYPVAVEGIDGSTRTATVTEGILDGGVIQGTRKAVREVRARGVMIGLGQDALDAGMAWLDSVLDGDQCSTHPGGGCGEVDACFFITCPPERPMLPDFSPWTVNRVNWVANPRMNNSTAGWTVGSGAVFTATPNGIQADIAASQAGFVAIARTTANAPALPNQSWIGSMDVTVPTGYPAVTVMLGEHYVTSAGVAVTNGWGPQVTIQPGTTASLSMTNVATQATIAGVGLGLSFATNSAPNSRVIISHAMNEQTTTAGTYFDGDTGIDNDNDRTSWSGATGNSPSWMESRFPIEVEMSDADYDLLVDPLRRRMHGVSAISGPLVLQQFHSGDHHAYEVEFTLAAATPYIFNMPKRLALTPTTPSVVQDSPFNLVTYPSAELAGANVVVATNYSTNPSVETNTTGWVGEGTASVPVVTRSNELWSVGSWSAKATFTATSASSAASQWMALAQDVNIPSAAGTRVSLNVWGSGSVQSGTAVLAGIDYIVIWWNGATYLGEQTFGSGPASGGAASAKSLKPPAGATKLTIRIRLNLTSWASGAVMRLYGDALAVTVP